MFSPGAAGFKWLATYLPVKDRALAGDTDEHHSDRQKMLFGSE
jgi:hypothetical protein